MGSNRKLEQKWWQTRFTIIQWHRMTMFVRTLFIGYSDWNRPLWLCEIKLLVGNPQWTKIETNWNTDNKISPWKNRSVLESWQLSWPHLSGSYLSLQVLTTHTGTSQVVAFFSKPSHNLNHFEYKVFWGMVAVVVVVVVVVVAALVGRCCCCCCCCCCSVVLQNCSTEHWQRMEKLDLITDWQTRHMQANNP